MEYPLKLLSQTRSPSPVMGSWSGIDTSTDMLYNWLGEIWQEEVLPTDWKIGHLVKPPKKDDRELSRNSAPISARKDSERLRTTVDEKLRDNRAGFCRERCCTDQIASL